MIETSITDGITNADIAAFYNDQLERMKAYKNGNNGRLNRIKNSLSQFIKPGMLVLDVGCGIGVTSQHMGELGAKVIAIDIAPELVKYAMQESAHKNVIYMTENVRNLDMNKPFDAIILADVFEHIPRDDVFGVIWRLLKYHANEKTCVYLNMPDYSFNSFMADHYRDKQQIIDEAWKIDDVISLFANWRFVPCAMQMYGIDVMTQYIEYLFIHQFALAKTYKERMKTIYGGNENVTT